MKIDFYGWLTIALALHSGVAWYCYFNYDISMTWPIVASVLFGGHLISLVMMTMIVYLLIVGSVEALASAAEKKQ